MLEHQKDIDAVWSLRLTHMHARVALAAMELGKQCVRPETVLVCRRSSQLSRRANETKVATQMGIRSLVETMGGPPSEYVWSGAIGDVREVHIWTNRPLGYCLKACRARKR